MVVVNLVEPIWMQLADIIEQHGLFCDPFYFVICSAVCILFARTDLPYIIQNLIQLKHAHIRHISYSSKSCK